MSLRSRTLARPPALGNLPTASTGPRVSVLLGTTGGDNAQMLNLARALGWLFEVKGEVDSVPMTVVDRIAHTAGFRLRRRKPLLSSLLWPDLILCSGGRRVIDALRIKDMSEGRSRIVCIGRPWADLDLFDLVITTPQYQLPERPNVLINALPLNQPDAEALKAAAAAWQGELDHLPKPWTALLVGGNSGSCIFNVGAAKRLAAEANALAARTGGALLISTSGRTPGPAADALLAAIEAPNAAFRWQKDATRNPHPGFLALADRFIVTSDSASMIAEAIATGRPASVFEVPLRRRSRWLTRQAGETGGMSRLRRRLTEKGLWIPARDMNAFHRNLRARGYALDLDADRSVLPLRPDDMERAVQAIRKLFPGLPRAEAARDTVRTKRSHQHGLAIAG